MSKKTVLTEMRVKEVNPELVRGLKHALKQAEDGVIVGFIGLYLFHNSQVGSVWVDTPRWWHTRISSDRVLGALERLKHHILGAETIDEEEPLNPEEGD